MPRLVPLSMDFRLNWLDWETEKISESFLKEKTLIDL